MPAPPSVGILLILESPQRPALELFDYKLLVRLFNGYYWWLLALLSDGISLISELIGASQGFLLYYTGFVLAVGYYWAVY